jgi:FAD/FMN-containing dehydrogenase
VRWANDERIALTPRGKASSGYGGVIPVKNGVVVDFYFMKDILRVDRDALTVTVQPGITWEQLDRELKKQGLTLRLYPTSYPSSSVGGWLARAGPASAATSTAGSARTSSRRAWSTPPARSASTAASTSA